MRNLILLPLLFIISMCSPVMAGVKYNEELNILTVSGETHFFQYYAVREVFQKHGENIETVYLWGPGGDMYAGLAIGRTFKKHEVNTVIPKDKVCISACAIMAIAGDNLEVNGEILFHGPYVMGLPINMSLGDMLPHMAEAHLDFYKYMADMGYNFYVIKYILKETKYCRYLGAKDTEVMRKLKGEEGLVYLYTKDTCKGN